LHTCFICKSDTFSNHGLPCADLQETHKRTIERGVDFWTEFTRIAQWVWEVRIDIHLHVWGKCGFHSSVYTKLTFS